MASKNPIAPTCGHVTHRHNLQSNIRRRRSRRSHIMPLAASPTPTSFQAPVGKVNLPQIAFPSPQTARSHLASGRAGTWFHSWRPPRLPYWELSPKSGEPALISDCSQHRPRLPSFQPVSGSKRPSTSLLGSDVNPCTRVIHQIELPDGHLTAP